MARYRTIERDITTMHVDCIVNAANERMLGGGGVDGAIHRAAGPNLLEACRAFPEVEVTKHQTRKGIRVETGGVRITPAFNLPSKFIIHTAGPIWKGGNDLEPELLDACYTNSLLLAALHGGSVAIPAISTGVFGFPIKQACEIAVHATERFMQEHDSPLEEIFLVTFMSDEVSECFAEMGVPNG
jgi:O-acetyl-ADP-ribose deacetylase (regulator of RNase III)